MRTLPQIAFVQRDIPVGTIVSYSGSILDIPSTYRLCDGTDGTPDLRDKFIAGSGGRYPVDDTGGAINHNHHFTGDGHAHAINVGSEIGFAFEKSLALSSSPATGTTDNKDGRPPYYSLAFVMYKGSPK